MVGGLRGAFEELQGVFDEYVVDFVILFAGYEGSMYNHQGAHLQGSNGDLERRSIDRKYIDKNGLTTRRDFRSPTFSFEHLSSFSKQEFSNAIQLSRFDKDNVWIYGCKSLILALLVRSSWGLLR